MADLELVEYDSTAKTIAIETDTAYGQTVFLFSQKDDRHGVTEINCFVQIADTPDTPLVVASNIPVIEFYAQQWANQAHKPIRITTRDDDFAPFPALINSGYMVVIADFDKAQQRSVLSKLISPE